MKKPIRIIQLFLLIIAIYFAIGVFYYGPKIHTNELATLGVLMIKLYNQTFLMIAIALIMFLELLLLNSDKKK